MESAKHAEMAKTTCQQGQIAVAILLVHFSPL
jgi:hypothetical protein